MDALQGLISLSQTARTQGAMAAMQSKLDATARSPEQAKAWEAAQDFEAMFLAQILNEMNESLPTDGYFGGGYSEQIYRGLLNEQYAKAIATRGGVGIAEPVYRVLIGAQEIPHDAAK